VRKNNQVQWRRSWGCRGCRTASPSKFFRPIWANFGIFG